MLRLLRRLHTVPETVLSRDRSLLNVPLHRFPRPNFPAIVKPLHNPSFDWTLNKRYARLWMRLANEARYEVGLRERAHVIQKFVGDRFPLLLPEAVSILTGYSDMDVWVAAAGERKHMCVSQERLRQVGRRFFDLNCGVSAIFSGEYFLAMSPAELEQALMIFAEKDVLVARFMECHSLTTCLIPFRRKRKFCRRDRVQATTADNDANAVGSFYTMLGLLVVKFGAQRVADDFWADKVFGSLSGILKIATERSFGSI